MDALMMRQCGARLGLDEDLPQHAAVLQRHALQVVRLQ